MNSKAELRREIEKKTSSYKPTELFSSPYIGEILSGTVIAECEKLGRIPRINAVCQPESDITACTEGTQILINTQNDLIAGLDTIWKQYVANVGMVTHECGHVLFTDFVHQGALLDGWANECKAFRFYPTDPKLPNTKEVIETMNKYPNYRKVYAHLMHGVENAIEDAYIENRLCRNFDGLAVAGLRLLNNRIKEVFPTLEELYGSYYDRKISLLSVATDIVLLRYKVGSEPISGHLSPKAEAINAKVNEILDDCNEIIRSLCWEQKWQLRCEYLNQLFVKFLDLFPLPDASDDEDGEGNGDGNGSSNSTGKGKGGRSKNGSSSDSSGNEAEGSGEGEAGESAAKNPGAQNDSKQKSGAHDLSDQEAKDDICKQDEHSKKMGETSVPEGNTEGIQQDQGKNDEQKEEEKKEVEENKKNGDNLSSTETSMQRELERAIKEAVTNQVLKNDEDEHQKDLSDEADQIRNNMVKKVGKAYFNNYHLDRGSFNSALKAQYAKIYRDVALTSQNLARKIANILKDREVDSVESGYLMGQRFNAKDVINRDGKYFSRQNIPDGKAKVVFGILVDESGSMGSNNKYFKARKAAILLEDVMRRLDIPCEIVGHTEDYGSVKLNVYSDFDTNDGNDRYRLANISARYGNIDGAAITYLGEKLLKRPEEKKVMIVISDGLPAGCSFYDRGNQEKDTRLAVEHYRRRKINIFGAIVDEYQQIVDIYGNDYAFDCRESGKLEADLCRLVKRYILAN